MKARPLFPFDLKLSIEWDAFDKSVALCFLKTKHRFQLTAKKQQLVPLREDSLRKLPLSPCFRHRTRRIFNFSVSNFSAKVRNSRQNGKCKQYEKQNNLVEA